MEITMATRHISLVTLRDLTLSSVLHPPNTTRVSQKYQTLLIISFEVQLEMSGLFGLDQNSVCIFFFRPWQIRSKILF